jgi:hypothetical protein
MEPDKAILVKRGQIVGKLGNENRFYANIQKQPKKGNVTDYATEWKERN